MKPRTWTKREFQIVHAAVAQALYGMLQDLRDRSLARRDIITATEELLRQTQDCRDFRFCLKMQVATKPSRMRRP